MDSAERTVMVQTPTATIIQAAILMRDAIALTATIKQTAAIAA
jgi:hypothetical protein